MNLGDYLSEIRKIRLLEPQEEIGLWHDYKEEGKLDCRQILIEHYQPLVFKTAFRWRADTRMIMDLIQEGTVGLIEAVESFDHDRGVAFSLYAVHRIRGRMLNHLEREGKAGILSVDSLVDGAEGVATYADTLVDSASGVQETVERFYLLDQMKKALSRLTLSEQRVLNGLFIEGREPLQVAEALNVSASHVYRLQKHGIRRMRGMLSRLMCEFKK